MRNNKTIARNNNFPQNLLQRLNWQIQNEIHHTQTEGKDKKKKYGLHFLTTAQK